MIIRWSLVDITSSGVERNMGDQAERDQTAETSKSRDAPAMTAIQQSTVQITHFTMVVKIRLARFGRRKAPFYNIVVAHARSG